MADMMTFPSTFMEFIKEYSFKDKEEIYTNGANLIPVFRVEQAWNHYTNSLKHIIQNVQNIQDCIKMINNNLYDIKDTIDDITQE